MTDSVARSTITISKFVSLINTAAEPIETTWDEWLAHLATEPGGTWSGSVTHGGWSPVLYDPPRRSKDSVRRVYALVLDHDKGGDWNRITALWAKCYGLIYTTKSHGIDGDRLRVVLPLSRPVTAEEYGRLWDWAAARSSEAECPADPQAKDASRFWYDASMPPGGWRAERLSGEPIAVDAILAIVEQPKLRVVQPVTRPSDSERVKRASAYLAKIPGAVSGDGGHTRTFNAVAHIMFGFDLSESDTRALIWNEYNPRCDPPWSEREIDHKLQSVAKRCDRERGYLLNDRVRVDTTASAAHYAKAAPLELNVDWVTMLSTGKGGKPRSNYRNVAIFVKHHPLYRGKWSIDTMSGLPWFNGLAMPPTMIHEIRYAIDEHLGFTPSAGDVEAAIGAAVLDRPFHPIRQYLRSVDWDGTERLGSMALDYLGTDDPLHAELVRRWMIGAAARALWPGCKVDTALMLVGAQGVGKSSLFRILGAPWHSDSLIDIASRDGAMQLHAAWIYELAELENVVTGKAESRLKAWMTSSHDTYRTPYSRVTEIRPRSVIICGSTNREEILTDDTGSRRFWLVPMRIRLDVAMLEHARDQLWAEAVCAAEAGEPWWLEADKERDRELANEAYSEPADSWSDPVATYLWGLSETSVTDILSLALKLELGRHDRWSQIRVSRILKNLGWRKVRINSAGVRSWKYRRIFGFVD